jgi:pimeloyl-ACP methyl ester carboxylesterase
LYTSKVRIGGFQEIPRSKLIDQYADSSDGSRFIKFNGHEVHLRENQDKEKPKLLALHGICDSLHTWDPWNKELEKHFHLIRIDLPFFGLTKRNKEVPLTREYFNQFIDDLVKELKLTKFSLLGHSLGAFLSWSYAAYRTDLIDKVVLLAPPGHPQTPPKVISLVATPILKKIFTFWTPKFILKYILKNLFYDISLITNDILNRYYDMLMSEGNREEYADFFVFLIKYAAAEHHEINKIKQPTLILWGEKDLWVPSIKAVPFFQKQIPHARIIVYPNMRHMVQYEKTKETLTELLLFFELPVED